MSTGGNPDRRQLAELREALAEAKAEIARLNGRMAELHQTLVKVTKETPYPAEVEDNRRQVGILTAKIGTLTNENAELRRGIEHAQAAARHWREIAQGKPA